MKVHFARDFSDDDLRRLRRGAFGRSGTATRKEVRIWIEQIIDTALNQYDDVPAKRKPEPAPPMTDERRDAIAAAIAPPDAGCGRCGQPFAEHFGAKHFCPLRRDVKPGARFTTKGDEVR